MFHVGRGYTFKAIRAKMLYNGGLRKVVRPSLHNRKERTVWEVTLEPYVRRDVTIDYGVDISALIQQLRDTIDE